MTLTTKFDVGSFVCYMHNNRIHEGFVTAVDASLHSVAFDSPRWSVIYSVEGAPAQLHECLLFPSREALVENLLEP